MSVSLSERGSWRLTTVVMLIFSVGVFLFQRFIMVFLDPVFEVCIIHIPALAAAIIYLRKDRPEAER